jgi:O-antigen/teichoic acid export membrane protein
MSQHRSILKNTLALSVPNLVNPLISFVLVMAIARNMGAEGLGEYSLVQSYLSLFGTFASLGLTTLIVREVSRRPEEIHLFLVNAILFGLISSLVSMGAMDAIVTLLRYDGDVTVACLVASVSIMASTAISYLEGLIRSVEKSEYIALTYLLETAVKVAACLALLWWGYGVVTIFVVFVGTRFLAALVMFSSYINVVGRPYFRFRGDIWRLLAREALTFASIAIFSSIHLGIDQIILSKLKTVEAVGIFSAADRLVQICKSLPLAFAAALLPFLTRAYTSGSENLRSLSLSCLRYLFLTTLPVVVGTVVLAEEIITLVYGQKFAGAASVLKVQICTLIPVSVVYILAEVLIVTDHQRIDLALNVVAASVNVALCFLLIPPLAEWGAALAGLITMVFFCALQKWFIRQRLFSMPLARPGGKALVAALGMGAVTYLLQPANLFLNVAISAAVYGGLLFVLKALTPEEMTLLTHIGLFRKG